MAQPISGSNRKSDPVFNADPVLNAGSIGVLSNDYDFDAANRDIISEFSTFIGNQIPGKQYKIHSAGRYGVTYSSNSDGSIRRTCIR
jgi:hypothetical protein